MTRRSRRTYSDEFKRQVVQLYQAGKPRKDILIAYDLTPSAFDKWVRQAASSDSFKAKDHKTPEVLELEQLRKRNAQLEMENDILKQAALIIGRK